MSERVPEDDEMKCYHCGGDGGPDGLGGTWQCYDCLSVHRRLAARVAELEAERDYLKIKLNAREVGARESAKYACGLDRDRELLRGLLAIAQDELGPDTIHELSQCDHSVGICGCSFKDWWEDVQAALDATADQPDEEDGGLDE